LEAFSHPSRPRRQAIEQAAQEMAVERSLGVFFWRIRRRYHNSLSWTGASAASSFLRYYQQRLNMSFKTDLIAIQFFSDTNPVSLITRTALGEVVNKGLSEINLSVKAVDFDNEKEICRQYRVYGVPMTLVFLNDKLIGRHYGERTSEEFEAIFKNYSDPEGKSDDKRRRNNK